MLTDMKTPIGVTDNTKVDFALGGLSSYVTTPEGASAREAVCKAYIKALAKATEWEVKAFIIRQLKTAGGDESVETLKEICTSSSDLYVEAAHALQVIATDKAREALTSSIDAISQKSKAAAAKLIGDNKLEGFESQLISWLDSGDATQQKAVLYALANVGGSSSIKTLTAQAAKAGYDYDMSGALDAYLTFIARQEDGSKYAIKLLKSSPSEPAQKKALSIMVDQMGSASLPYILEAVKGSSAEYRSHALRLYTQYATADKYSQIVAAATSPRAIGDILLWCNCNKAAALKLATESIGSSDSYLVEASAKLFARDGGKAAVGALVKIFTVEGADVELVADYLNTTDGDIITPTVNVFDSATKEGKIAIMDLWQTRRISQGGDKVKSFIAGSDSDLDKAARNAMTTISTPADLGMLYGMLSDRENLELTQKAIVNGVSYYDADKRYSIIKSQMNSDYDNRELYFMILAGIESPSAIATIKNGLSSEDQSVRDAAAEALTQWNGIEALEPLSTIATDSRYGKAAVAKYVELVNGNKAFTDQMKYLHLRTIAEQITDSESLNLILTTLSRYNSFGALLFAGKYIDNSATEQAACLAIMRIATANPEFIGEPVKELLEKFIQKRTGIDAVYEKQNIAKLLSEMPDEVGYYSMFNGKDLSGWKGLVANPIARSKMSSAELAKAQEAADEQMRGGWEVRDGVLYFTGHGNNLCTEKQYGNFEMYVDWKIEPDGDAGIYLRGTPQVQVWDTCRTDVGAEVGSGGLYNNQKNPSKPLKLADNKIGEWNSFYIKMVGERVTVYLNGELVVDNTILENYWDRSLPIFPIEQIELQAHGTLVGYRDLYIRELPMIEPYELSEEETAEGFVALFDGVSMNKWTGNTQDYVSEDGVIALYPSHNYGGNLYTKDEYGNFVLRFEFQLTAGANNGLGIRTPMGVDAAYHGMELQILDNEDPIYKDLAIYQYHGSVYGVIPAKRGFLKPLGEWNVQEVVAYGNHIKVTLNGEVILDGDIYEASNGGEETADHQQHPGLLNAKGHIGFLGHGSALKFRNIRIKELK